jgi:hypothetical protein
MRQVRDVLRLKWAIGLSERTIAHGRGALMAPAYAPR